MNRHLAIALGVLVATAGVAQTPAPRASQSLILRKPASLNSAPIPNATAAQQEAIKGLVAEVAESTAAVAAARDALTGAALKVPANEPELRLKVEALAGAELNLALARARAFARIQSSEARFGPEQMSAVIKFVTVPQGPSTVLYYVRTPTPIVPNGKLPPLLRGKPASKQVASP